MGKSAEHNGDDMANLGGKLTVINRTFYGNRAGQSGSGSARTGSTVRVTNSTYSDTAGQTGGGLYSNELLVLANSQGGAAGSFGKTSTNNLIEAHENCRLPNRTADPRLGKLGYHNGPTQTMLLRRRESRG